MLAHGDTNSVIKVFFTETNSFFSFFDCFYECSVTIDNKSMQLMQCFLTSPTFFVKYIYIRQVRTPITKFRAKIAIANVRNPVGSVCS